MRSHLSSADSAQNIRSTTLVNCNPLTKNVFGFGLSVFLTWQSKKQSDEKTFQCYSQSVLILLLHRSMLLCLKQQVFSTKVSLCWHYTELKYFVFSQLVDIDQQHCCNNLV